MGQMGLTRDRRPPAAPRRIAGPPLPPTHGPSARPPTTGVRLRVARNPPRRHFSIHRPPARGYVEVLRYHPRSALSELAHTRACPRRLAVVRRPRRAHPGGFLTVLGQLAVFRNPIYGGDDARVETSALSHSSPRVGASGFAGEVGGTGAAPAVVYLRDPPRLRRPFEATDEDL